MPMDSEETRLLLLKQALVKKPSVIIPNTKTAVSGDIILMPDSIVVLCGSDFIYPVSIPSRHPPNIADCLPDVFLLTDSHIPA